MDQSSSGKAADIPDDFKTPLARLYKALHENGVERQLFLSCLETAGFTVAPSTLGRWVARLDTIGNVISQNEESGNEPALSREQRDIASGMVLHENANGNIVSLDSFKCFVQEYFDLIISYSTILRYLDEDSFSCRLIHKKGKSFVVDVEALREALWNWVWIQDFRCRGIKKENYASIDFTFTSHRNHRRTSFAPRGGPQPIAADDAPLFTNCIVTCA